MKHSHRVPRHLIGGVAMTNGVLLHTPDAAVMAIRNKAGDIITKSWDLPKEKKAHPILQIIGVRGLWLLWRTVLWHSRIRRFADIAIKAMIKEQPDFARDVKGSASVDGLPSSLFPSLGLLAAFLFYALFVLAINATVQTLDTNYGMAESTAITFVFTLLLLIYLMRRGGIWEYMGYHGAEHQAIAAHESGKRSYQGVTDAWPYQMRCGAAVVSYVAVFLAIIGYVWPNLSFGWSIVVSIGLFSLAYEIILFLDRYPASWLTGLLSLPGVLLQFFVARHPSSTQSEVAAKALYELTHYSAALKSHSKQHIDLALT